MHEVETLSVEEMEEFTEGRCNTCLRWRGVGRMHRRGIKCNHEVERVGRIH